MSSWSDYQSRRDLIERFSLVRADDLKGKRVIDFGCNTGENCFLAIESGAYKAVGVDIDDDVLRAARDKNHQLNYRCEFHKIDLSRPFECVPFDVGFVFAVHRHIRNNLVLAKNIKTSVTDVVYFESHQGRDYHEIPEQMKSIFSKIDHLGMTDGEKRNFYRCEISDTFYRCRGTVKSGAGFDSKKDWSEVFGVLDYTAYPGTLNVAITPYIPLSKILIEDLPKAYNFRVVPGTINGINCHIGFKTTQSTIKHLFVIAEIKLRDKLGLKDNDDVDIEWDTAGDKKVCLRI